MVDFLLVFSGVSAHLQIFQNRQIGEHPASFGDVGNSLLHDFVLRHSGNLLILKSDRTGLCAQHAADSLQGGGFAGTVCADQCDDLAFVYLKGDVFKGVDHAVIYIDIFYSEHCHERSLL